MYDTLPGTRPATPLLDRIDSPADLRALDTAALPQVCDELRRFLLYTVARTGGHFGAGLGVVELTVALHRALDTPHDALVWDVGHQAYPHKILTGRREAMATLRTRGGIAPFPLRSESAYDVFGVGHSSTSISAALGVTLADRLQGRQRRVVAVIGDGALSAGMAWEALNDAVARRAPLLIVLNDNGWSISPSTGGLNAVLSGAAPDAVFTALGLGYSGPLDGHDVHALTRALAALARLDRPHVLHVRTRKGAGYRPAERDPLASHALTKIEPGGVPPASAPASYSSVFGRWLCEAAVAEPRLVAITPAMLEGSGMAEFARRFAARCLDVAIAEQHALTLAGGLAVGGMKPVVAIYSTFLQRAWDQLVHDLATQNLDVLLAIDRAGLVEDGPTHSGVFDLAALRCVPNLTIMAPADAADAHAMLDLGLSLPGPAAVRYPRGAAPAALDDSPIEHGRGRCLRHGDRVALLSFGALASTAMEVATALDASVYDMRFVKPLDHELVSRAATGHALLVTLEEGVVAGGAGSAVNEWLAASGQQADVLNLGIPDRFMAHGAVEEQLRSAGLDAGGVENAIRQRLAQ